MAKMAEPQAIILMRALRDNTIVLSAVSLSRTMMSVFVQTCSEAPISERIKRLVSSIVYHGTDLWSRNSDNYVIKHFFKYPMHIK